MLKHKKMRKRIPALLICVLYTMSVLLSMTGCGTKQTDSGGAALEGAGAASEENSRETQEESGSVAAMGRYMESTSPLPEGASVEGRNMTMLTDGRLAYFDAKTGLHLSPDEGKSWTPAENNEELLTNISEDGYVSGASIAPDGSILMSYLMFEGEEASLKAVSSVIRVGADGTRAEVPANMEDGDYVSKVFAKSESESIALSIRGRVFKADWEKGELEQLFTLPEQPEMVIFVDDRMLCLGNSGVTAYDMVQGINLEKDVVLDEFCRENMGAMLNNSSDSYGGILFPGEDGAIYVVYRGGLYRHVENGNAMEQLIDGSFSSLGDPALGLCGMLRLESGEFLYLTTGEELIRFTYDPDEPTVPEKQLKVYSLVENYTIRQAISIFQKQNPDVYINYEYIYDYAYLYGQDGGSAITPQDALKNLNVELMSGNGPDVLLLDGMDADIYVRKGMLADLSDVLEELTGEKKVFENIASAYKEENGTFIIPASFQLPMICGKKEDVEAVKDLATYAQLVERLRAERPESSITGVFNAAQELKQLLTVNSSSLLQDRKLNTEALTEFMNQAVRIYQADMAGISKEELEVWGENNNAWTIGSLAQLTAGDMIGIMAGNAEGMLGDIGAVSKVSEEKGYVFDLWSGMDGTGFIPTNKLAVSAGSSQTELAKRFIELMLDTEIQKTNSGVGLPVNREAFDIMSDMGDQVSMGGSWKLGGREIHFSYGGPSKASADRLKELVEQVDRSLEGNTFLEDVVVQYGVSALTGSMSVEEAVSEIQQKSAIYLAE